MAIYSYIYCFSILILGTYIYHQIVSYKWIYKENEVGLTNYIYTMRIYILTDSYVSKK